MTRRERNKKENTLLIIKVLSSIFIMPALFILAFISTISSRSGDGVIALVLWTLFLIPIILWQINVRKRARKLKNIVALYDNGSFAPQKGNVITEGYQVYLGADAIRGTILYIYMTREGVYDVLGLDMNSWTRIQRVGNKLKISTKIPECPSLEIAAPGGERDATYLYDVICAMEHRVYEYKTSFPQYVKQKSQSTSVPANIHLNCFA